VAPLVTPLVSAAALAERLTEHGFRPVLDLDPSANAFELTTRRTLGRILTEAATNILRCAPIGSACQITLRVDDDTATLRVVSPSTGDYEAGSGRRSDLSLGRGLRGIQERSSSPAAPSAPGRSTGTGPWP